MPAADDSPTPNRPRRERSTRYPGVPLSDSVKLCEFIQAHGLDGLTAGDIATALGYKNIKTNTFSARLSAARQFALLDLTGDGYALTPLARSILHPVERGETPKFYRQALLAPTLYAELSERLSGKKVPETAILANILYHHHQIIATAKDSAAEAFLDSAKFAGALGDDGIFRPGGVEPPKPEVTPPLPVRDIKPIVMTDSPRSSDVRIDLRLWGSDQGKTIRVRAPESVSRASFERFLQALTLHVRIEDESQDS